MISVEIHNAPAEAIYWLPVFRVGIYENGGGQTYYPNLPLLIDESWEVALFGSIFFRVDLFDQYGNMLYQYQTMFAENLLEDGVHYIYDYIYQWLNPTIGTVKYYLKVAEGNNTDLLMADSANKNLYRSYRYVMEMKSAPRWVLSSISWVINSLRGPLRLINVDITKVYVMGKNLIINMGDMTDSGIIKEAGKGGIETILAVIFIGLAALGIIAFIGYNSIQQEITKQMDITLKSAQTTGEMVNTVMNSDLPPEIKQQIVDQVLKYGSEVLKTQQLVTQTEGGGSIISAIKWGIVGVTVVAVAVMITPLFKKS